MFCGKCGKNIPPNCEFCMNCGTKTDESNTISEKQTEDISNAKKKISRKSIVSILTICIVIASIFIGINIFSKDDGYVRNTIWGMSVEEVENSEEISPMLPYDGKGILSYFINDFEGLEGTDIFLMYSFDKDLLVSASTLIIDDNLSRLADDLITLYSDKYGNFIEKEKGFYLWETKESMIEIVVASDELLMISFTDVNYEE